MASDLNQANSFAISDSLKIQRVGVFLGARVSGIDLTQPLSNKTVDELKLAHANHGDLIFPNLMKIEVIKVLIMVSKQYTNYKPIAQHMPRCSILRQITNPL